MSQHSRSNSGFRSHILLMGFIAVLLTAGCEPKSSTPTGQQGGASDESARKILDAVAETYANAKSYEDVGELYVEAEAEGKKQSYPAQPFTTTFERPNRFRVHVAGVSAICDGELLRGTVPGIEQILTLPAPEKLEVSHVLGDKILGEALHGGLETALPPLRLLVGDRDLPGFAAGAKLTQLSDAKIEDKTYQRVQAATEAGKTVYWIDPKTHVLQRIEFATDAIAKQQQGEMDSLKIWADFVGARFDDKIADKAFEFESPPNAQLVKRLMPPPPQPPSSMLGQEATGFAFENFADGETVDRESVQGKVVVFDFWATWCGYCFMGFPNVQKVYDKFQDDDKVAIFAVNTDASTVSDEEVKKSFADAKLHLPIARDRKDTNKQAFEVQGLPTLVVLDGKGVIQHVHVGYDPNTEQKLTAVIEDLLAGKDVAKTTLEAHEAERSKYEKELNEALIGTTSSVEVPESQIAERSEPSTLKMDPLWTAKDVSFPGNLLVVEPPGEETAIYVLSESKKVVQLKANGEVVSKIDLKLPETVGVSSLRTAVDAAGERYFVTFASTQQQLYLFDKSWQPLLAYPESSHKGLADVQLGDLDGDGQPEILAGYWDVVGVQAASLSGQRKWSNRQLENVTRLAISDPADDGRRFVLCVNNRDFITPIDHAGKAQSEIPVAGRSLYGLFVADLDGATPSEMCALSSTGVGVVTVIGLNAKGDSLWEYPLPNGLHRQPVELVTPGSLPTADGSTQGAWLLAGPDGSIHILAADGKLIDKFNFGDELTGLATASLDGKAVLIVSAKTSLQALTVEPK